MEATGRYQQVHILIDLLTDDGCGGSAAIARRCSDGVSAGTDACVARMRAQSSAQSYGECPAGPRETHGESCGSLSPGRSTAGESAGTCSPVECKGERETGAALCEPAKSHGFACSAHELAAARSMYVPHDALSGRAHDDLRSRLGAAHDDPHPWALFWKHAQDAPEGAARGTPAPLSLSSALEPRDFTLEMLRASLLAAGVSSEGSPEAHPPLQLSIKQMTLDEDYLDNIAAN